MALIRLEDLITPKQEATFWRNDELARTDILVATPDHPQRGELIAYRTALRDWPSTSDFPDTRPTLGS